MIKAPLPKPLPVIAGTAISYFITNRKRGAERRGHWVLTRDEQYEYCHCSECGYDTGENWMIGSEIPYCSQCGSKNYDGGADNG